MNWGDGVAIAIAIISGAIAVRGWSVSHQSATALQKLSHNLAQAPTERDTFVRFRATLHSLRPTVSDFSGHLIFATADLDPRDMCYSHLPYLDRLTSGLVAIYRVDADAILKRIKEYLQSKQLFFDCQNSRELHRAGILANELCDGVNDLLNELDRSIVKEIERLDKLVPTADAEKQKS